ncbi:MAG: copper resistance protein CopC [Nocardioides sp.]|uniref:copper resistance CopC family protein n=1 Tax=Nocardioides sp. TaxID=35761 RepID=UPI0039E5B0B9
MTLSRHPAMRHRATGALAAAVLLAGAAALGTAAPAAAHTALVSSTPEQGQEVDRLPTTVTLTFTEEVEEPIYVSVIGPDGAKLAAGDPQRDGATVSQDLVASTGEEPSGTYTVAYRVVSDDGHPVSDELTFTLADNGTASTSPSTEPTTAAASPDNSSSATAASQADEESAEGFWARHATHVIVGAGLVLIALILLLWSRRSAR